MNANPDVSSNPDYIVPVLLKKINTKTKNYIEILVLYYRTFEKSQQKYEP